MKHRHRVIAVGVPAILYGMSMILPVGGSNTFPTFTEPGYVAFEAGMEAIDRHDLGWHRKRVELIAAWLANPAIWIALVCLAYGRRRAALLAAGAGSVLAMSVLPTWLRFLIDYPGYWFWWGSAVAAVLTALFVLPPPAAQFAEDFGPLDRPPSSGSRDSMTGEGL